MKQEQINSVYLKITIVLASIIIIMLAFLIFKNDDKDINDCISKGHSRQVCEKSIIGY